MKVWSQSLGLDVRKHVSEVVTGRGANVGWVEKTALQEIW